MVDNNNTNTCYLCGLRPAETKNHKPKGNIKEKGGEGFLYSSGLVPVIWYIQRGGIPLTARLTIFFK